MGFLVKITISGTDEYVSMDGYSLTHNWKPRVLSVDPVTYTPSTDHGGYVKLGMGNITFNPLLFQNYWPPPVSCPITFYWTDTDEASMVTVCSGYAYLASFDRVGVTYNIHPPAYSEMINVLNGVAPNNALVVGKIYGISNFVAGDNFNNIDGGAGAGSTGLYFQATGTTPTTWSNGSQLVLARANTLINAVTDVSSYITEITLNTTYTRSIASFYMAVGSSSLAIDVIDSIAQAICHVFYISGTVGYFVDMKVDNTINSTLTLSEFQYFSYPQYACKSPVSTLSYTPQTLPGTTATGILPLTVTSLYTFGSSSSASLNNMYWASQTTADNLSYLTDIMNFENQMRISVSIPMSSVNLVIPGQRVTFIDTSTQSNVNAWLRARKITYDFTNQKILIEGEGGVS